MLAATSPSSESLASTSTLVPAQPSSAKSSRSKYTFCRSASGGGGARESVRTSLTTDNDGDLGGSASTMITTNAKRCEGKDALCRAMGTLFLQHRVDKLQRDVDEMQREGKNQRKGCGWKGTWKGGCRKGAVLKADTETEEEKIVHEAKRNRIIIADVSLLVYSLRTVYNWLKEGDCKVIVPAEALRTLDVLKKGEHCLNLAARKATRFLDEKCTFDDLDRGMDTFASGLYAQKSSEKVTVAEWRSLEMTIRGGKDEMGHSHEAIMDLPHTIRETLACTLFFVRQHILYPPEMDNSQAQPSVHLALALPPPHLDCSDEATMNNLNQNVKYAQRADGSTLMQVGRELGLADGNSLLGNILIVAPTAASWLTVNPSVQVKR